MEGGEMTWQALAGSALSLAGNSALGGTAPPPPPDVLSQRNPINIAPVGVNLGAILQPFREGSTTNGGFELEDLQTPGTTLGGARSTPDLTVPVIVGTAALALGVIVYRVSRR